jgi:hypothetical protein
VETTTKKQPDPAAQLAQLQAENAELRAKLEASQAVSVGSPSQPGQVTSAPLYRFEVKYGHKDLAGYPVKTVMATDETDAIRQYVEKTKIDGKPMQASEYTPQVTCLDEEARRQNGLKRRHERLVERFLLPANAPLEHAAFPAHVGLPAAAKQLQAS